MIATSQDFASPPTVDINPSQTQTKLGFEFRPIQLNLAVKLAHVKTSSPALLIYLYLVDRRNGYKSGICTFPFTLRQIQKAFGTKIDEDGKQVPTFTLRTIKRAIKELEHSGLIQLMRTTKDTGQRDEKLTFYLPVKGLHEMGGKPPNDKKQERQPQKADNPCGWEQEPFGWWEEPSAPHTPAPVTCQKNLNHDDKNLVTPCKIFVNDDKNFASSTPETPVVARNPQPVLDSCSETSIVDPPPIVPQHIEKLSLAWNESHEYEEGEGEEFDKYFDKAIRATMAQHAVDENVATAALARAFHRTKRNPAGHHPYDYPTAYTGDPDHSESNATPRGKKILQGAIHVALNPDLDGAVKAGSSSHKQPSSESNDSIEIQNPTHENMNRGDSDNSSAAPSKPKQAEPSPPNTPQTPLERVRRNLVGRAHMLKAGIISPLSREDVLSHAQSGLDGFDDIPGDDVILGVWDELAPDVVEPENTSPEPAEQSEPQTTDAFMELGEIQAKIAGLDEMRRSGTLSVDEVAEVTQEIATLKRKKLILQKGRGNIRVDGDSDKCSACVDKDADKGVYDAEGAIETGKGDCTHRRFVSTAYRQNHQVHVDGIQGVQRRADGHDCPTPRAKH